MSTPGYDPGPATALGLPAERDAGDVLRQVLATPVADQSATETMASTWTDQHHIARLWTEYAALAATDHRQRYGGLVASSGLSPAQLAQVRGSRAFGPLLAALRDAEASGLIVERVLPRLVEGRPLGSADDIAAVLHRRVSRWARAAGADQTPAGGRIVGLLPAAGVVEPGRRSAGQPSWSPTNDFCAASDPAASPPYRGACSAASTSTWPTSRSRSTTETDGPQRSPGLPSRW